MRQPGSQMPTLSKIPQRMMHTTISLLRQQFASPVSQFPRQHAPTLKIASRKLFKDNANIENVKKKMTVETVMYMYLHAHSIPIASLISSESSLTKGPVYEPPQTLGAF